MGSIEPHAEQPENPQVHIRPIAICVFRHGSRILAGESWDSVKGQLFHRPVGGGIHFGETSREAMLREIREELGLEVEQLRLLGVLENLFTCEGEQGHEVVFVYDAQFVNKQAYERDLVAMEAEVEFCAVWRDLSTITNDHIPLYPDGLREMLDKLLRPGSTGERTWR
jgi:ADP-ribose pyrophosphatase YjhB (NUDIX family)